jgi:hypothetical protein
MDVQVDARSFAQFSRALKGFDDDLRKHMLKGVRDAARPLQVKLRESVRGLDSSAKSSGGHVSRGAYSLRGHKGTAASVLIASGLAAKAAGRSGLRDSIARSIRIVAKDSGYGDQVGVRVAQHGGLPADQRRLPRHMDKGGWRHPVMGDRDIWVFQTVTPSGWWSNTVRDYGPEVIVHVQKEINAAMDQLAASITTAA